MIDSVLNTFLYLFAFVFVLSVVVIVHEWGHFIVARLCGVKVTHFSLGFGKVLWKRIDKKGTQWQVCLWPLGGYVKMLGDEDAASAKTDEAKVPPSERKYMFLSQPLYKRAAVIFAGPAMNYIFAIVLFAGLLFFAGRLTIPPVVGSFLEVSPARDAGMMIGDRIVKVNGIDVHEHQDVVRIVRLTEFGKTLDIEVDRGGQKIFLQIVPKFYEDHNNMPLIGIQADTSLYQRDMSLGFFESIYEAVQMTAKITTDTVIYLGQILFSSREADGMRGPLGIAEMSGDALKGGVLALISFIANISVAVGFMNLLPIPLLDGGHLFFYAIEGIIRRPLSERIQNALLWGGMVLLFGLLAFTMYLDVPRIFQRILG